MLMPQMTCIDCNQPVFWIPCDR